jgi:hypothetical protein
VEGQGSEAPEGRLSLSRDLDLLADRISGPGAARRAHELRLVAAMLRDKAARPRAADSPAGPDPAAEASHRYEDYLLAASLFVGWLVVVLAVVALSAAAFGATPSR